MRGISLIVILLAAVAALPGKAASPPAGFADKVTALLAENKVPSVSIAVIQDGKILYAAAYGEQSAGVPATPATLYNIASLTKPISAEVVLRLASLGKLGLDEPMSPTWLDPDLAGDKRADLLTPRLALSHRTGFPNWRRDKPLGFIHEPGEYGYSGEGYQYVTRFAARKADSDLESLAISMVFTPAGMKDTAYTARPWFQGRIALPVNAKGDVLEPIIGTKANAADLVYTTASDYARFMIEVMKDAHLSPAIATERRTVQTDLRAKSCKHPDTCPDRIGMALGWEVVGFGPKVFFMHDGSDEGVKTLAYLSPTDHRGLVILTNSDNGPKLFLPLLELVGMDEQFLSYLRDEEG